MKVFAYNCRSIEMPYLEECSKKYGLQYSFTKEYATFETASLAKGYECISILTGKMDRSLLEKFYSLGIRYISTRTIGYEHIDIDAAKELGITVAHVRYPAHNVADFTTMLILMSIRKMNTIFIRSLGQDYRATQLLGKELNSLTVGIIGTGQIGNLVIKQLSGFGCKILAYSRHEREEMKAYVQYVDLKTLYQQSDIISLHAPAAPATYHLIDKQAIAQMKPGVIIVNTARGSLIDTPELINGLESGKVGAAALDVLEGEEPYFYYDCKYKVIQNRNMALLRSYPNVILTPHIAYYTEEASYRIVDISLNSCQLYYQNKSNPYVISN